MPRIKLSQAHSKSPQEVKAIIDEVANDLKQRYDITPRWEGDSKVKFKRSGVKGELAIHNDKVTIDLDIGLLLSAFSGQIKSELANAMAKKLA